MTLLPDVDTAGKRGRKATPPDPDEGPVARFALELWRLKIRAGDPSFAAMCTRLGAAASRSSLAAAARGTVLPSWDTTWEFVRALAVGALGADEQATRHEWQARWTEASAAVRNVAEPLSLAAPSGAARAEGLAPGERPAQAETRAPVEPPGPAEAPTPPDRPSRPTRGRAARGRAALVGALAAGVVAGVAGVATVAAAYPPSAPEQAGAVRADDSAFEGDLTFPDGSTVARGERFSKVWQVRNTGSVRWENRFLTRMNTTACQAPQMVPIPATEPGAAVRITVPVTAADSATQCKIYWKMTDATQRLLLPGKNPIFLDVTVR